MRKVSYKYYGVVAFANKMGKELFDNLCKKYEKNDALKIYLCALLRSSYGDIKNYWLFDNINYVFKSFIIKEHYFKSD